ncbi:MAG: hypothetical protein AAF316_10465 [Cyanobacteria bacterium P01_A01_bin.80]
MSYPNATFNAQDHRNFPSLSLDYQAKDIEVFFGDVSIDSVFHYRNGEWITFDFENLESADVVQVLIDDQWAFIQVRDQILLDRLGGFQLPALPKQEEIVRRFAQQLGMEVVKNA